MTVTRMAVGYFGTMVVAVWLSTATQAQESHYAADYEEATETAETAETLGIHDAALAGGWDGCGCSSGGCGCGGCGYDGCGCGGCGCCCDPCCRSQGAIYGAEVSWLKPHHSNGTGVSGEAMVSRQVDIGSLDTEFDPAYRLWIGWQRCDGLGVRVRYWEFDHDYASGFISPVDDLEFGVDDSVNSRYDIEADVDAGDAFTVEHAWDVWVLDIELMDSTRLGCNWDMTYSAGFRYVDYTESSVVSTPSGDEGAEFYVSRVNFTGIGATAGMELRRQFTCNLGFFLNLRVSAMMGDNNNELFDEDFPGGTNDFLGEEKLNDVKFIYEGQGGVEYIVPICCGGYYFVRGGVELQWWDDFGVDNQPTGVYDQVENDPLFGGFDNYGVGFGGFTISAGIQR